MKAAFGYISNSEKAIDLLKNLKGSLVQVEEDPKNPKNESRYYLMTTDQLTFYSIDVEKEQSQELATLDFQEHYDSSFHVSGSFSLVDNKQRDFSNSQLQIQQEFLVVIEGCLYHYVLLKESDSSYSFMPQREFKFDSKICYFERVSESYFISMDEHMNVTLSVYDLNSICEPNNFRPVNVSHLQVVTNKRLLDQNGNYKKSYSNSILLLKKNFLFVLGEKSIYQLKVLKPYQIVNKLFEEKQFGLGASLYARLISREETRISLNPSQKLTVGCPHSRKKTTT